MTNKEKIMQYRDDDAEPLIFFDCPDYDSAIIGVSERNKVVYSFEKMVQHLMDKEGWTYDEAIEFIEYNTLCFSERDDYPIIVYDVPEV